MVKEERSKEQLIEELKSPDYTILSALLDFYSDRAVSHATLLVACVFGLFTVLTLLKGTSVTIKIVYTFTYWLLWASGLYELFNFNHYATEAEKIRQIIQSKPPIGGLIEKLHGEYEETLKRRGILFRFLIRPFLFIKNIEYKVALMGILYFLFIGVLPWFFTVLY